MRLYLDNCCFNRPYDKQHMLTIRLETEAKLHIQNAILIGQYQLGWSYILDYENAANPFEERRIEIQKWKSFADSYTVATSSVLVMMEEFIAIGIKPKDALHIACAKKLDCEYFLTVDKGILRKAEQVFQIQILSPIDFVIEEGL